MAHNETMRSVITDVMADLDVLHEVNIVCIAMAQAADQHGCTSTEYAVARKRVQAARIAMRERISRTPSPSSSSPTVCLSVADTAVYVPEPGAAAVTTWQPTRPP